MMRKPLFGLIAIAAICTGLASCTKESINEELSGNSYSIRIPVQNTATKAVTEGTGKAVSTFRTTDNVYVYNESTKVLDNGVLHPSDDAHEASFVGTLNESYNAGNVLRVLYNTGSNGVVDYSSQDGSLEDVIDAGEGEVTIASVSGSVITTNSATIDNLQSIFKFTFRYGGAEIGGIRFVRIFSGDNKLQAQYNANSDTATYGPVTVSRDSNLENNCIYAGLRFDANPSDVIVFQVVDENGKVYSGSKTAPATGFAIGKFYNTTVDVNLYTFTVASGKKVCFSPGDLGLEIINSESVYSFTEPFTNWAQGNTTNYNNASTAKAVSKRTWFDFYFESGLANNTLYGITGWRIPNRAGSTTASYEWNYLVNSRTMNAGVALYYKVTIPGYQYCLLLPPDEAQSSDIGDDLTSGTVTDYVKYLGKGFVLLFNTNSATYSKKWSWGSNTSSYVQQGFYWTVYNNSNRYYFTWPSSGPKVDWMSNRMRNHIRYVHDVE